MRIFTDTVCKQYEYQNMAPRKNSCGVSTLQKQRLLTCEHRIDTGPEVSLRRYFVRNFEQGLAVPITPQEAQARFARARLCLPYNEGRKETLRPK